MHRPPYITFDYETAEVFDDGRTVASTEAYRKEFRVISCAFSWLAEDGTVKSSYGVGEEYTRNMLQKCIDQKIPLVAHNIQFEKLVTKCRFPDLYPQLLWHACTMRLTQNFDNGGDSQFELEKIETLDDLLDAAESGEDSVKHIPLGGLGLAKACKRILGKEDHKKEAYDWIRANVPECGNKKPGMFLDRLPPDILERYNVLDTERTLDLYEHTTKTFDKIGFDWTLDHQLYLSTVEYVVDTKIRGVLVDRVSLAAYIKVVQQEMADIAAAFLAMFPDEIKKVERMRLRKRVLKFKKLKGVKAFLKRLKAGSPTALKDVKFNPGSNDQLAMLFVNVLKIVPQFFTDTKKPAFRSAVLHSYGPGGELLLKRRKRLLILKQSESLYALSAYDGRWHLDIRAAGTATGRMSGGQHA